MHKYLRSMAFALKWVVISLAIACGSDDPVSKAVKALGGAEELRSVNSQVIISSGQAHVAILGDGKPLSGAVWPPRAELLLESRGLMSI